MAARIVIFVVGNVVFGIAVEKSVGKNLIKHPALCPVGHVEAGNKGEIVLLLVVGDGPQAVVKDKVVIVGDLKVVTDFIHIGADKFQLVKIEGAALVRALLYHLAAAAAEADVHFEHVVF